MAQTCIKILTYKYKLYRTKRTKWLNQMLRECAFVWNHALALQRRYLPPLR
nr:MAG TPA: helix-turn-helix domain protein [Herelleviridae sp.]